MKNLKTNSPIITVIIPIFNGEEYVEAAVKSVLKNSYKSIEILLINDGSTDLSGRICQNLAGKYPQIWFYSFAKNRGLSNTLNFALKKAKGQFIARLNQDDLMTKDRLQKQLDFLEQNPKIVAVGSYLKFFSATKDLDTIQYAQTDSQIRNLWYLVSPFADPAVMYRKNQALKAGGYKQAFWPADDLHLWYRLSKFGEFANIPEPLTRMRLHSRAASNKHFRTQIINTYKAHLWAHRHLQKASITTQIYWLIQLASGLILGPKLNWKFYKRVKQLINWTNLIFQTPTYLPKTNL